MIGLLLIFTGEKTKINQILELESIHHFRRKERLSTNYITRQFLF